METNYPITDELMQEYTTLFGDYASGAGYTLAAFMELYRECLQNTISRQFTRRELCACVDVVFGLVLFPFLAGNHLYTEAEDLIENERLNEKWGLDEGALLEKIRTLTVAETAFLEIWAKAYFWGPVDSGVSVEAYADALLAMKK